MDSILSILIMCLIDNRKFRISLREKVCYKILVYRGEVKNGTMFETPVQETSVLLEKDKTNVLVAEDKHSPVKNQFGEYEYYRGFIHAFTDSSKAESIAYHNNLYLARNNKCRTFHIYRVFECIIPRFTRYGYDAETKNICARKMIVKQRIC